jgi:hypothetical protein
MADDPKQTDPRYVAAKRHVAAVRGFYIHGLVFACVMSLLLGINIISKSGWWVQWPLFGWGIGLLAHALTVYTPFQLFGSSWEERKINEYIAKK